MRLILDTDVLVAAMLAPDGPPHLLLDGFLNDRFTLITSDVQLEEFSRVTRYPGIRSRSHRSEAGRMVNALRSLAVLLDQPPTARVSRDPYDDYLFALAKAGDADYLVTGDKAGVLAARRHGRTQIVTARRMVAILKL